ncbi:MAG: serine/threonine-protein kinase [Kofleriaceae bacterium]
MRIGQVFLGKYKVESILGQGGMGVVAECTHLQLNERVAIKMLRPDVVLDPDAVERFMREAQAAVKLKSEYVARVSDVGTLETGTPYMVMEFLEGIDLGALIDERGCVPVPWACELILQTAEALSEAHSINIVHRDIKPANLFVTWRPDGTALIKVLDFGISKAPMGTDMHLTQTQSLLGTPAYMSPEQMRSAKLVDARTDIWSLGSVMYELIEGRKPFEAESFSEMCVKVAVDPPQPMHNAPPELQHVILKCLAKSPDLRYASMAELGRDLVPFCNDPHQASLLVERMQRMLRRSDGGPWETQTGQRSVPNHIRDPKSQPMIAQPWQGGSEPAAKRFSTPSPVGGVPVHAPHERSAPAQSHSEWGPTQKSSSKRLPIIAFTLLALVGVGVGLALGLQSDDEPSQRVVEPVKTEGTTAPVETKATAPVETTTADTKTETADTTTADTTTADTKAETADTTADTKAETAIDAKAIETKAEPPTATTGTTGTTTGTTTGKATGKTVDKTLAKPPGGKTTGKTTGKASVKTTKETTKVIPKETPKETPACDPFANPRGCGTKK